MIEFLDQNGVPLEIGDEIEYWSSSYKDWLKAKVVTIEATRRNERARNDLGDWAYIPTTKVKIKVAKWDETYKSYRDGYDLMNLRKSAVIRKVV